MKCLCLVSLYFCFSAGWERILCGGAGVGETNWDVHVAWTGGAVEIQTHASRHAKGGVVWRWDVFRGKICCSGQPVLIFNIDLCLSVGFLLQVSTERLKPFSFFTLCFCKNSFASLPVYKDAIYQICEVIRTNMLPPAASMERECFHFPQWLLCLLALICIPSLCIIYSQLEICSMAPKG